MTEERKPALGFGAGDYAVALEAPVEATARHKAHQLDRFVVELKEDDTASIYLSEADVASGYIPVTRASMTFPISFLVDLDRRRPMTAMEREELARAEEEAVAVEEAIEIEEAIASVKARIAQKEAEAKILK